MPYESSNLPLAIDSVGSKSKFRDFSKSNIRSKFRCEVRIEVRIVRKLKHRPKIGWVYKVKQIYNILNISFHPYDEAVHETKLN